MEFLAILLEKLCITLTSNQPAKRLPMGYTERWRDIGPLAFGINGDGEIFSYEIQLFGQWIFSSTRWMGTHVASLLFYSGEWLYE